MGLQLLAVNGEAFSKEVLIRALKAAQSKQMPIVLLVKDGPVYRSLNVEYYDGPRWPHLARDENASDYLSEILAPRR